MSNVEYVKDPIYADETGERINCFVKFNTVPVDLPFTAYEFDVEPHGREIWKQCKDGVWGPVAPYVPPPPPQPTDAPTVV